MYGGSSNYAVDTGAANAYAVSVGAVAVTSYTDGLTINFKAAFANTGASTVNVNALGLKTIGRADGTALLVGDIVAGQILAVSYNATTGKFQLGSTGPQGVQGPSGLPVLVIETATAVTGVANTHHALTNVAASTVTLPGAPVAGNTLIVTPANALASNIIARNGNNIMSLAQDMTLDNPNASATLRYINSTVGWRLI